MASNWVKEFELEFGNIHIIPYAEEFVNSQHMSRKVREANERFERVYNTELTVKRPTVTKLRFSNTVRKLNFITYDFNGMSIKMKELRWEDEQCLLKDNL